MQITISIKNGPVLTATMEDNQTAQDFMSLLPMALELKDFNQTEKVSGELPKPLAKSDTKFKPVAGDLTYYAPWGNLAIFYRDFQQSPGLYKLGHIDSNPDIFSVPGQVTVTIELKGK